MKTKVCALLLTAAMLLPAISVMAEDDNWIFTHLNTAPSADILYATAWKPFGSYAAIAGQRGTLIECNGTTFYSFRSGTGNDLRGVAWSPDASIALVAGYAGTVRLFDGVSTVSLTSGIVTDLRGAAWAPNGSQAIIVGNLGVALRYNPNNSTLTPLTTYVALDLMAVSWAPNGSYALIVGRQAGGSATILQYNGTGFATVTNTIALDLRGVDYAPNGTALIVGSGGTIYRYDGATLTQVQSNVGGNLHAVSWAPNGTTAMICGDNGVVLRYQAGAVNAITSGTNAALYSVCWEFLGNYSLIVGATGTVLKYQGIITRLSVSATNQDLRDVEWNPNGTLALLVGAGGTVLKFDGLTFTTVNSAVTQELRGVGWSPNGTEALIVGQRTGGGGGGQWVILLYNYSLGTISRVNGPGGGGQQDLWDVEYSPSGSEAIMVGAGRSVLRYVGGTVTNLNCPIGGTFRGIGWRPDGTVAVIVGNRGNEIVSMTPGTPPTFVALANNVYQNLNRICWLNNTYGLISGAVDPMSTQGTLIRYDLTQGTPLGVLTSNAPNELWGIDFKPGSNYSLVAGFASPGNNLGTTIKFDLTTCTNLLPPTFEDMLGVNWKPDASYALLVGTAGRVLKWGPGGFDFSNTPPTVAITYPAPGAEVHGTVIINGTAADPDQAPQGLRLVAAWIDDGIPGPAVGLDLWNLSWDTTAYADGNHTISALALDSWANSSIARITVMVNNTGHMNYAPLVNITSPTEGSIVKGTINITGSAWDLDIGDSIARVEVMLGNASWTNATGTSNWSILFNTSTVLDGNFTIRALAFDASNLLQSIEAVVNVTINNTVPPDSPPVVTITFPPELSLLSGVVDIQGTAMDPDASDVINTVFVRIGLTGTWTAATGTLNWSFPWNTSLVANGPHTIYARAHNGRLNFSAEAIRNVTVSNVDLPPFIAITAPLDAATVSGNMTITGTARDQDTNGTIVAVSVRIDSNTWLAAIGTTSWTFPWSTVTVPNGAHSIQAFSFDGIQNSTIAAVNVIVNNQGAAPPVAIIVSISPSPAVAGTGVSFSGRGESAGTIVSYRWLSSIDGQLSTAPAFNTSSLTVGNHTIRFQVQDNAGVWSAEASATLMVTPSGSGTRTFTVNAGGDRTVYVKDGVTFIGSAYVSAGSLIRFMWDFGDGQSTSGPANGEVRHTYNKTGTFTVRFQVWDELGGTGWSEIKVTVKARPTTTPGTTETGGAATALAAIGLLVVLIVLAAVYFMWSSKRKAGGN